MIRQAHQLPESAGVQSLRGVGPRTLELLAKMEIYTLRDFCFHLPTRYEDRTRILLIADLHHGDSALVQGAVVSSGLRFGRRRTLVVQIDDGSGVLVLRFFHFSKAQQARFQVGQVLRIYGVVRVNSRGEREIVHPETTWVSADNEPLESTLTAVYPLTEGIGQAVFRRLMAQVIERLDAGEIELDELLPAALREDLALPPLAGAIRILHKPPVDVSQELLNDGRHAAQRRLIYEELLSHHLSLRRFRASQETYSAPVIAAAGGIAGRLLARLPFSLTSAQERVGREIAEDMARPHPMSRLVQGDVGCGKTLVAALAITRVVESGLQAVMMAPTELLAEQHGRNFRDWLEPLGIRVAVLAGARARRTSHDVIEELASGQIQVAVGTHALFQDKVQFSRLGLVIIDEQHRFGVRQRFALREKGRQGVELPHQLIMTATPIPRTLAMTLYADLDVSIIDELPPGRSPITTVAMSQDKRAEVISRIREAAAADQQIYWVCPLIEESETLQCEAATVTAEKLRLALPQLTVGLVHGRLRPHEKDAVMDAFRRGEIDLLVATSVIEVGVDVPRATLMIIENAERLGLAQLHQLRGRVGRGEKKSVCVLLYQGPLSADGRERLAAMRETNDGFEIARRDLEIRGPGEVFGTRQSGALRMRIANLVRDAYLIGDVVRGAALLEQRYPELVMPLIRRWVGDGARLGNI